MSRFIYKPMDFDKYKTNYVNTLKTGELLVDFKNFDILVTEDGVNIPIPTTKNLKDKAVDFLTKDMEGISIAKGSLNDNIGDMYKLKQSVVDRQNTIWDRADAVYGSIEDLENRSIYISKVTERNVNQLGDIVLQLDGIDLGANKAIMLKYVNDFNAINNDSSYSGDSTQRNKDLIAIWNNLDALMVNVNQKLVKMGSFEGSITLTKNVTKEVNATDVYYSDFLYNYTYGDARYASRAAYLKRSLGLKSIGTKWFNGKTAPSNPNYKSRFTSYENETNGTNILYRGFKQKLNLDKKSYKAGRVYTMDALESLPLKGYHHKINTYDYLREPTCWILQPFGSTEGWDTNVNTFATRIQGKRPTNPYARYDDGKIFGKLAVPNKPIAIDVNRMSTVVNNNQRKVKFTATSANPWSNHTPALPIIVKKKMFVSDTGAVNREFFGLRLGIKKRVRETTITTKIINYSNTKGWS